MSLQTTTAPVEGPGPTTAIGFQVAVDCADPHVLARFWAAALGYELEVHESFIRDLLERGVATEDDVTRVDGTLHWKGAAAIRRPGASREEARQNGARLLFQTVPEPKAVKNRWHLDLHVGEEHREREVKRLVSLGASVLHEYDGREGRWTTMADPEGNEFCVS